MNAKKPRYHTKTVHFQGKELTLFSLDGATWSTRKDELLQIQERQETGRVTFEEIKSGVMQKKEGVKKEEPIEKPVAEKVKVAEEPPKVTKVSSEKKVPTPKARKPAPKAKAAVKEKGGKKPATTAKNKKKKKAA